MRSRRTAFGCALVAPRLMARCRSAMEWQCGSNGPALSSRGLRLRGSESCPGTRRGVARTKGQNLEGAVLIEQVFGEDHRRARLVERAAWAAAASGEHLSKQRAVVGALSSMATVLYPLAFLEHVSLRTVGARRDARVWGAAHPSLAGSPVGPRSYRIPRVAGRCRSGTSISSSTDPRHFPCASSDSERVTPPANAPTMTKLSAPRPGNS
jgi:hypothetical protein